MGEQVVIDRRFRGPLDSANGGYACGVVGTLVDAPAAEATLRIPPPLDTPMERLALGDGSVELRLAGEIVGEAKPAPALDLEIPEPPSFDQAAAAGMACPWAGAHAYPECFTCGPHRDRPDGLHQLTGPIDGREIVADTWVPVESDADAGGAVDDLLVWAAVDCPSGNGPIFFHRPENPVLLGRLTASLQEPVRVGERHVVFGWPVGRDGRKHSGGSAICREDGTVCASAAGIWIERRPA